MTARPPAALLLAVLASACATAAPPPARPPAASAAPATPVVTPAPTSPPFDPAAVVAAPDRTAADRALDAGRRPAELLAFSGVRPGLRVAELAAADGYTAELLARSVAPGGVVYAQNSRTMLQLVGADWARRLERPAMRGVVRLDQELTDPFPASARGLDLVVFHAGYHDTLWLGLDRARMNQAVFDALRPGGAYVVVDSSAPPGAGKDAAYDFHRVDEALVRREVEAAGFRLAGEAAFLRNPADTRDWSTAPNEAGPRRGTSDRFVLRFVRP